MAYRYGVVFAAGSGEALLLDIYIYIHMSACSVRCTYHVCPSGLARGSCSSLTVYEDISCL